MDIMRKVTTLIIRISVLLALLAIGLTAFAGSGHEVQTEGDCVKTAKGDACRVTVFKQKNAKHNQVIYCGDTFVYTDPQGKALINAHVDEDHDLVLVKDGKYVDGHCY